jgi:release factor glutamine methyltransferase
MHDVRFLLAAATHRLGERAEAEILLAHVLGKPRSWLIAHADDPLDAGVRPTSKRWSRAASRASRSPISPVGAVSGRSSSR